MTFAVSGVYLTGGSSSFLLEALILERYGLFLVSNP